MVDPSGDHQGHRRPGEDDPDSGSYGGDHQQAHPCVQTAPAGAGA